MQNFIDAFWNSLFGSLLGIFFPCPYIRWRALGWVLWRCCAFIWTELVRQCLVGLQVIAVNGQFPGPLVNLTTNWNTVVNVFNNLDEPLLMTWYEFLLLTINVVANALPNLWYLMQFWVMWIQISNMILNGCVLIFKEKERVSDNMIFSLLQEWFTESKKLLARWCIWDQLPCSCRMELDL